MTAGPVNRALLDSFFQQPGDIYDDSKTEGAFDVLADQLDENWGAQSLHRTTPILDHPDGSVTNEKIANATLTADKFVPGVFTNETQNGLAIIALKAETVTGLVNVKSLGAKGDGISHPLSEYYATLTLAQIKYPHATALTDEIDWAACQLAVSQALIGNKDIYIPSGEYMFGNNTLTVDRTSNTNRPSIIGEGSANVKINHTGSGSCIFIKGLAGGPDDSYNSRQRVSGLTLVGGVVDGSIGINLKTLAFFRLKDIYAAGFDIALQLFGVEHSSFEEVMLSWNKRGLYGSAVSLAEDTAPNNLTFYSCTIGSNSVYGAYFDYPTTVNFIGGNIENNGTAAGTTVADANFGIKFMNSGFQGGVACNLIGVYIESNAGAADVWFENGTNEVSVDNSTVYSVVGCTFNKGTSTHYTLNNIRCTFGIEAQAEKQKLSVINSSFKSFNNYVPSAARKTILFNGVPQNAENFEQVGNIFGIELEKPSIHRIAHQHVTVSRGSTQSLANTTWTKWQINLELNSLDFSAIDTVNNQIVIPQTGVYMISATVMFGTSVTGLRGVRIKRGAVIVASIVNGAEEQIHTLSGTIYANKDEVVTIECYQSSGGALNLFGADTQYSVAIVTKIADMAV